MIYYLKYSCYLIKYSKVQKNVKRTSNERRRRKKIVLNDSFGKTLFHLPISPIPPPIFLIWTLGGGIGVSPGFTYSASHFRLFRLPFSELGNWEAEFPVTFATQDEREAFGTIFRLRIWLRICYSSAEELERSVKVCAQGA